LRALFDTHALLGWLSDDPAAQQRCAQVHRKHPKLVIAASAWEIGTEVRLGKLPFAANLAANFVGYLEREGFELLSISAGHGIRAGLLPAKRWNGPNLSSQPV
jgi:PIN domain nuclease of toxin-antitoxin system